MTIPATAHQQDQQHEQQCFWVSGEMDKLSMEEAGFTNVVSVPHGAPQMVKQGPLPERSKDKAFAYVWNCWTALEQAACILLATDDDVPGHALAEELARRLGKLAAACPGKTESCDIAAQHLQGSGVDFLGLLSCLMTSKSMCFIMVICCCFAHSMAKSCVAARYQIKL